MRLSAIIVAHGRTRKTGTTTQVCCAAFRNVRAQSPLTEACTVKTRTKRNSVFKTRSKTCIFGQRVTSFYSMRVQGLHSRRLSLLALSISHTFITGFVRTAAASAACFGCRAEQPKGDPKRAPHSRLTIWAHVALNYPSPTLRETAVNKITTSGSMHRTTVTDVQRPELSAPTAKQSEQRTTHKV